MRVFLSSHGASLYGAERILLAQAEGLAGRGYEVTLEVPHEGPALERARALSGVRVWESARPRLPRTLAEGARYGFGFPRAVSRLTRHLKRERYDLVWVNTLFNPPAALAAKRAGLPVVWHIHERNFRGWAGHLMARLIASRADLVVVDSRFVRTTFEESGRLLGRVHVLPEPLLTHPSAPASGTSWGLDEGGDFTVGYLGQLEPRKRPADVVRAVSYMEEARAVLVGDGKDRSGVESVVRDCGLEDRIEMAGFQADVSPFLERFDCLVVPSREEPWGLVAMEGMAAGVPVVAADHGGLPEVLGDAALYFPLGDATALADCLHRLMRDAELRMRLRDRGLERARRFGLEGWLDHVEDFMDWARTGTPPTPGREGLPLVLEDAPQGLQEAGGALVR